LTAVDMAITPGFHLGDDGAEDPTEFKVDSLVGGEHELGQAWEQVLKPHLDEVVIPVVRILEHHIASAHATLRTASQASAQFDAESFVVDFRTLALSPRQATRRLCSHGECIDQNGRHFGAEWPGSRAWQNSFAPESTA